PSFSRYAAPVRSPARTTVPMTGPKIGPKIWTAQVMMPGRKSRRLRAYSRALASLQHLTSHLAIGVRAQRSRCVRGDRLAGHCLIGKLHRPADDAVEHEITPSLHESLQYFLGM